MTFPTPILFFLSEDLFRFTAFSMYPGIFQRLFIVRVYNITSGDQAQNFCFAFTVYYRKSADLFYGKVVEENVKTFIRTVKRPIIMAIELILVNSVS